MIINISDKEGKMNDKFLTIKEICSLLKVSRGTVNRWILSQKLQSKKIGRLVRVTSQALGMFIEGRPHRKPKSKRRIK